MIVTRHLDYSVPYRSLLMGRGLEIPYLGDRLLDALVALLVRIHLEGFFWGDCSLSNTLFRRDAGALQAYIIDVETAEHHQMLTDGQRQFDVMLATDNVAGGLLDLQAGGRLTSGIDPIDFAIAIEGRYKALWTEITSPWTAAIGMSYRCNGASSICTNWASRSRRWRSSRTRTMSRSTSSPKSSNTAITPSG